MCGDLFRCVTQIQAASIHLIGEIKGEPLYSYCSIVCVQFSLCYHEQYKQEALLSEMCFALPCLIMCQTWAYNLEAERSASGKIRKRECPSVISSFRHSTKVGMGKYIIIYSIGFINCGLFYSILMYAHHSSSMHILVFYKKQRITVSMLMLRKQFE